MAAGGSTTTLPTRVAIAGGPGLGQFRDDGTLGANCGVFNFNPFNYYQTPLERYNGTVLASLDVSENVEVYSMFNYGKSKVAQQVAPSGVFGTGIFTPLANPLIGAQARTSHDRRGERGTARGHGQRRGRAEYEHAEPERLPVPQLDRHQRQRRRRRRPTISTSQYRRRTGRVRRALRGLQQRDVPGHASACAATSPRTGTTTRRSSTARRIAMLLREGYTNLTNFENALQTTDGVTCANGDATCVPINLFGGFGSDHAGDGGLLRRDGVAAAGLRPADRPRRS